MEATRAAPPPRRGGQPPPASDYVAYVESFNHNLKLLTRDLVARYPKDATVWRAEKRIMTVISIDPVFVIKAVGPFLYGYREQVYALEDTTNAEAEKFFLENTFESDFSGSVDMEKVELVQYILPRVKESARTLDAPKRQEYKRLVIALLDDYVEFLAATTPGK